MKLKFIYHKSLLKMTPLHIVVTILKSDTYSDVGCCFYYPGQSLINIHTIHASSIT